MCYSVQPKDRIFVKSYGVLSFAKNVSKNTGKNISKHISGQYSQKFLDQPKQPATDYFKTASNRAISKNSRIKW